MEALAGLAVLNCFVTPVLLIVLIALGYFLFRNIQDARKERTRLADRVRTLSRTAQNAVRELWFDELSVNEYASELEVETKFLFPLMRHLGYSANDLRMRVGMMIRVGRNEASGIADWVAYQHGKPVLVIEAKESNQALNQDVQDQARSYCFAMNVPAYMLTNGKEIKVFKRGVESDLLIFKSETSKLSGVWVELRNVIGVP